MKIDRLTQANYFAFLGHRLSGLALAIFLPFHFLTLGLALENGRGLDQFLRFSEMPLVKIAEWGLVTLLSVHLFFGTRLLMVEFLSWKDESGGRTALIGWGAGGAVAVGLIFLMGVF